MRLQSFALVYTFAACLFLVAGCATVHQPPGIDSQKLRVYNPKIDDPVFQGGQSEYFFTLSVDEAIETITGICFTLDIPLYHPMVSIDKEDAWIASGMFVAKCKRDCDCETSGAAGYGADLASGTISLRIKSAIEENEQGVLVEISSMFYRTQSSSGEYGSTWNLYFNSTGRIERKILVALRKQAMQP